MALEVMPALDLGEANDVVRLLVDHGYSSCRSFSACTTLSGWLPRSSG